jgi:TfoX/Sxy family transcriptional regulator of competence genes
VFICVICGSIRNPGLAEVRCSRAIGWPDAATGFLCQAGESLPTARRSYMTWRKSPPELVVALEKALPADPRAERRKMFGYPCCFAGGNMFAGLHQESMILRLPAGAREELLALPGAAVFEPMPGRRMKEYVTVPPGIIEDPRTLAKWVARSFAYASSLPRKRTRVKRRKKRA